MMVQRFVTEGVQHIMLGANMSPELRSQLDSRVRGDFWLFYIITGVLCKLCSRAICGLFMHFYHLQVFCTTNYYYCILLFRKILHVYCFTNHSLLPWSVEVSLAYERCYVITLYKSTFTLHTLHEVSFLILTTGIIANCICEYLLIGLQAGCHCRLLCVCMCACACACVCVTQWSAVN